jgi:hypothetical protein
MSSFYSKLKVPSSMVRSRRRMKVHAKKVRAELERQFPGLTFKRFEVIVSPRKTQLIIMPTQGGMTILEEYFPATV